MSIAKQGSVRADLLGGTLDLHPINLILPKVYTINIALSLQAKVKLSTHDTSGIKIYSKDYQKEYHFSVAECSYANIAHGNFSEMALLMRLLLYWQPDTKLLDGLLIELESGAPAGSGLGGSSAMAITFMKAIRDYLQLKMTDTELLQFVINQEAIDLDCGPTGYQDYYPALYGGVLALEADAQKVCVHQMFNTDLQVVLENNMTLIYSGKSRFSAINNWEVYKSFFNQDAKVRVGLSKLAELTVEAYQALINKRYLEFLSLIKQEGEIRRSLFHNIETAEMKDLLKSVQKVDSSISLKVCGAGGGGCFLLIHPNISRLSLIPIIEKFQMQVLDFSIMPPN